MPSSSELRTDIKAIRDIEERQLTEGRMASSKRNLSTQKRKKEKESYSYLALKTAYKHKSKTDKSTDRQLEGLGSWWLVLKVVELLVVLVLSKP